MVVPGARQIAAVLVSFFLACPSMAENGVASKKTPPSAGDASDLFAWTPTAGHLALILMVQPIQPFAVRTTRFTPGVDRRIILRRASIAGTGSDVRIETGAEVVIHCRVEPGKTATADQMRCGTEGPLGTHTIAARVGDEAGSTGDGMRLFAGARRDPFFINIGAVRQARARDGERHTPRGPDSIAPYFILTKSMAVVMDIDVARLFGDADGLFAVAGETDVDGAHRDRLARPEITGFILSKNWGAPLPGNDVRSLWNRESTFAIAAENRGAYETAMEGGLERLDDLDRFPDPRLATRANAGEGAGPDWPRPHPLADLLLLDVLVVDPGRPCSVDAPTFFEIEMANYRGLPPDAEGNRHQTCGGRTPNDDAVDEVLTLFINGPDRVPSGPPLYGPAGAYSPHRGDGIDRPRTAATNDFPFLRPP